MKRNLFLMFGFQPVYDNDGGNGNGGAGATGGDGGNGGAAAGGGAGANGNGGAGNPPPPNPDDEPLKKLNFTPEQQKFFNEKLAEEKRKAKEKSDSAVAELRKIQQAKDTTETQKKELQERIDELNRRNMSKEELAKQETERQQREYQQTLKASRDETELWKGRYNNSTILRALQDGALEFEAYNAGQIVDMLWQKTKLVDEIGEDSKPTGELIPRVHLVEITDDGKTRTLDLSVREALQKMKNTPSQYGNLFKSTLAGGLGGNGSPTGGNGRKKDPAKMSPAEYAAERKKDPSLSFTQK